jgi:hypothetical protein
MHNASQYDADKPPPESVALDGAHIGAARQGVKISQQKQQNRYDLAGQSE